MVLLLFLHYFFSEFIKLFNVSCVIDSKTSIIKNNEKATIRYSILTE